MSRSDRGMMPDKQEVGRCLMFESLANLITPSINSVVEFAKRVPGLYFLLNTFRFYYHPIHFIYCLQSHVICVIRYPILFLLSASQFYLCYRSTHLYYQLINFICVISQTFLFCQPAYFYLCCFTTD